MSDLDFKTAHAYAISVFENHILYDPPVTTHTLEEVADQYATACVMGVAEYGKFWKWANAMGYGHGDKTKGKRDGQEHKDAAVGVTAG